MHEDRDKPTPSPAPGRTVLPPATITDLTQLDASIDQLTTSRAYADETVKGYTKVFGRWSKFCTPAHDPLQAPWTAWHDLAMEFDRAGHAPGRLSEVLHAVDYFVQLENNHRAQEGQPMLPPPAPRRTEHRADWRQITKGYDRRAAGRQARGDSLTVDHPPMMRKQLRALMAVSPLHLARREGRSFGTRDPILMRALVLLALDTGRSFSRITRAQTQDFTFTRSGDLRFDGALISCDHRERVVGVPWDCCACSVRQALLERSCDHLVAPVDRTNLHGQLNRITRSWPALRKGRSWDGLTSMTTREGISSYELAGTRRGMVLIDAFDPTGGCLVMAKAWIATAWAMGARMSGDLAHLPRSAVRPSSDGDGFVLSLIGTKDDPSGAKEVRRTLPFASDGDFCHGAVLAEYLAVRDAACGRDGFLFLTSRGRPFPRDATQRIAKPLQVANVAINALRQAAEAETGVELPHFTSYSIRKGFAEQFLADGGSLERLQVALRHAKPETTYRHYRASQQAQGLTTKLQDALREETA